MRARAHFTLCLSSVFKVAGLPLLLHSTRGAGLPGLGYFNKPVYQLMSTMFALVGAIDNTIQHEDITGYGMVYICDVLEPICP